MQRLSSTFAAALMLIGASLSPAAAHEGHNHNLPVVEGKVVKVDESAGTVTIKHSAIPNLQMEAMTMVFKASEPAMLKQVKEGDAVNFIADKVNGQLTVTDIEKR